MRKYLVIFEEAVDMTLHPIQIFNSVGRFCTRNSGLHLILLMTLPPNAFNCYIAN